MHRPHLRRRRNNSRVRTQILSVLHPSNNSDSQNNGNFLSSLIRQDSIAEKPKSDCCFNVRRIGIPIVILFFATSLIRQEGLLYLWIRQDNHLFNTEGLSYLLHCVVGYFSDVLHLVEILVLLTLWMSRPSSPRANVMAVQMNFLKERDDMNVDGRMPDHKGLNAWVTAFEGVVPSTRLQEALAVARSKPLALKQKYPKLCLLYIGVCCYYLFFYIVLNSFISIVPHPICTTSSYILF